MLKITSLTRRLIGSVAGLALAIGAAPAFADEEDGADLIMQAKETLKQCEMVAEGCSEMVANAAGVLVFPEVLKADLIIGGAGGNGVLMVGGEPVGFYDIGKASIGLQAGIDESAMVYVFNDTEALMDLRDGDEWEAGATAGITVIKANADARIQSGDTAVYVFDADGLNAEISVDTFRIWEDRENAR